MRYETLLLRRNDLKGLMFGMHDGRTNGIEEGKDVGWTNGLWSRDKERENRTFMRFVSESLPRLISGGADDSDSLPQMLTVRLLEVVQQGLKTEGASGRASVSQASQERKLEKEEEKGSSGSLGGGKGVEGGGEGCQCDELERMSEYIASRIIENSYHGVTFETKRENVEQSLARRKYPKKCQESCKLKYFNIQSIESVKNINSYHRQYNTNSNVVINYGEMTGLKLLRIIVPAYSLRGKSALLECRYDLEADKLYSITWYKDHEEFYRYVPRGEPMKHSYRVEGVKVDELQQIGDGATNLIFEIAETMLDLNDARRTHERTPAVQSPAGDAAGRQPAQQRTVQVRVLPQDGPSITGEEKVYATGDVLGLNCTSGKSYPATTLKWFINGEQVKPDTEMVFEQHGLYSVISSLRLQLEPDHIAGDKINVRVQTIANGEDDDVKRSEQQKYFLIFRLQVEQKQICTPIAADRGYLTIRLPPSNCTLSKPGGSRVRDATLPSRIAPNVITIMAMPGQPRALRHRSRHPRHSCIIA
ncbi:hypothetical protein WN51_07185 [Melipona quadrifasciata]|uniref:Ig-like domain-containing protein n=1 Tax=Melipona quadrifasciata TaxID=166423 RepID=A0A0M9AAB5_9HYME|nr:hypothetical protein WN51_07185 [Melipona quadrifasciata]